VWATGHRPRYPWLDPALLDHRGALRHHGGVLEMPGMYVLGLPFTRRRGSNLLAGVGADARLLSEHLVEQLRRKEAA
jgi:putative flavoprotein involved in K+ transport